VAIVKVLRIKPSEIFGCVSFQSVSMTPLSRASTTSRKPCACQKRRTCGHTSSGDLLLITSQRSEPSRWIFMPDTGGMTVGAFGATFCTCWSAESEVSPPCGGSER